jgi:hypothetical protein
MGILVALCIIGLIMSLVCFEWVWALTFLLLIPVAASSS